MRSSSAGKPLHAEPRPEADQPFLQFRVESPGERHVVCRRREILDLRHCFAGCRALSGHDDELRAGAKGNT